jgi:deoxyribose-phosphate aldolase
MFLLAKGDHMELNRYFDHTLLKPDATSNGIIALCEEAREYHFASVCVNPDFVPLAAEKLQGSDVKVCTVIGFPLGANVPEIKALEAKRAILDGAGEVDMVLNVSKAKEGDFDYIEKEIRLIKEACGDVLLKVILETGLLVSPAQIARASFLAMEAGADFIKTSTGKVDVNATPVAAYVMCEAIRRYYEVSGRKVGFKAAGGISTAADALCYYYIVANILGRDWLCRERFRFGVSRLGNSLLSAVEKKTVTYF